MLRCSSQLKESVAIFISRKKKLGRFRDIISSVMENEAENKVYVHYNHSDSCSSARWTARESYRFMYDRAWQDVIDFYSNVVNGRLTLSTLFGTEVSVSFQLNTLPSFLLVTGSLFWLMLMFFPNMLNNVDD